VPTARPSFVRAFLAAAAALVFALALPACQLTAASGGPTVSLRVTGNVADAHVTIDDIPVGALGYVAARGVALPPGKHRITVERAGYFPWDTLVEAKDDPIYLQITLVPIPD
jgi:PEGA domain